MTDSDDTYRSFATRAARGRRDARRAHAPLSEHIVRATTWQVTSSAQHRDLYRTGSDSFYLRFGNPTLSAASEAIACLENSESALLFSSGMGAITTSLLSLLRAGDHVVAQRRIFAQTHAFLDRVVRALGVETTFVDPPTSESVARAIRPATRVVYLETPSNPELEVVDIAAVAAVARAAGAEVLVDGTFASPCLQQPLALGATLVLHSGTKYLGGHSDVLCGAAAGRREIVRRLREMQIYLGTILDPQAAWLLLRGMKTLAVRVPRQSETALQIARFLARDKGVRAVRYPWLEGSAGFEIARRQMRAGGGVVSFELQGGRTAARAFLDALQLIPIATSLGGVETVVEIPADLDFADLELDAESEGRTKDASLVPPGLIRLSVGLEDAPDLLADLGRGLAAAS